MMDVYSCGPVSTNNEEMRTMQADSSGPQPSSIKDKKVRTPSHFDSLPDEPSSAICKKVKVMTGHSEHLRRYFPDLRDFKATNYDNVDVDDHAKLMLDIYNFHSRLQAELSFDDESYTDDGVILPEGKGPTAFGFFFEQGIIVAVDRSDSGKSELATGKIINFHPCAIGCITGEVADVELLYEDLLQQGIRGTVKEVSERLADSLSSHSGKGVSGILIAGWDGMGHQLCALDGKGNLFTGKSIACGSCSQNAVKILNSKNDYCMSYLEAAKFARLAMRSAVAASNCESGYEASESDESDESVSVFWIGSLGFMAGIN